MNSMIRTPLAAAAACFVFAATDLSAATLFSDSFDRPDDDEINASTAGVTDNVGVGSPAYSLPYGNDNVDGTAVGADGGDTDIAGNQLAMAIGAGTSNAYINHNFVDAAILTAGGFSVSVDVSGNDSQSAPAFGGAFAIGMSMAEAAANGDAFNPGGNANLASKMTEAFNVANNGNPNNNALNDTGVSDFWVALRADNTLAWGSGDITAGDGPIAGIDVGANVGTISANFFLADFNAGSTVDYTVFFNGAAQGSGSFQWSGANENYIGLDARQNQRVLFDDFIVNTIPEPCSAALLLAASLAALRGRLR